MEYFRQSLRWPVSFFCLLVLLNVPGVPARAGDAPSGASLPLGETRTGPDVTKSDPAAAVAEAPASVNQAAQALSANPSNPGARANYTSALTQAGLANMLLYDLATSGKYNTDALPAFWRAAAGSVWQPPATSALQSESGQNGPTAELGFRDEQARIPQSGASVNAQNGNAIAEQQVPAIQQTAAPLAARENTLTALPSISDRQFATGAEQLIDPKTALNGAAISPLAMVYPMQSQNAKPIVGALETGNGSAKSAQNGETILSGGAFLRGSSQENMDDQAPQLNQLEKVLLSKLLEKKKVNSLTTSRKPAASETRAPAENDVIPFIKNAPPVRRIQEGDTREESNSWFKFFTQFRDKEGESAKDSKRYLAAYDELMARFSSLEQTNGILYHSIGFLLPFGIGMVLIPLFLRTRKDKRRKQFLKKPSSSL